jgi:hypothetical protein
MAKRYEVTHTRHYIGGRLVSPGQGEDSIVTLDEGIEPGRWLVEVVEAAQVVAFAGVGIDQFAAKHNGPGVGAGNWVVERISDGSHCSVVFKNTDGDAKAKAKAEADRLNAGGEIALVATDGAPSSGQDDLGTSTQTATDSTMPDA